MEKLFGQLVIVDPGLQNDDLSRKGNIGVILSANQARGKVTVGLDNGKSAQYPTDKLLVLKDKNELYQEILIGAKGIDREVFKQLLQINMHQEHGNEAHTRQALIMAAENPQVMAHSLVTLDAQIMQGQSQQVDTEVYAGR